MIQLHGLFIEEGIERKRGKVYMNYLNVLKKFRRKRSKEEDSMVDFEASE